MTGNNHEPIRDTISSQTIDLTIRVGCLFLLGYWSLKVVAPLLTIMLWSAVLTVALYPLFEWLASLLGRRGLAAGVVTVLSLLIVVGPVAWLGFGLIDAVGSVTKELDAGQ